jgi:hypothetical protein
VLIAMAVLVQGVQVIRTLVRAFLDQVLQAKAMRAAHQVMPPLTTLEAAAAVLVPQAIMQQAPQLQVMAAQVHNGLTETTTQAAAVAVFMTPQVSLQAVMAVVLMAAVMELRPEVMVLQTLAAAAVALAVKYQVDQRKLAVAAVQAS